MSHFALVAPPYPSHFAAFQALAGELHGRGHRVSFMHQPQAQRWVSDARVGFVPVATGHFAADSLERALRLAANPSGPWRLRKLIAHLAASTWALCQGLPGAFAAQQVDAVLCDQMEPAGALAAEACGLPALSIACALPINREPGLPLPVMPFGIGHSLRLYTASTRVHDWLMQPLQQVIDQVCQQHALTPRQGAQGCLSPLAELSQTPLAFDFPRQALPAHFHAVGPLRSLAEPDAPRWLPAPGKALVFASLGTLQGHRFELFARIAKACRQLDLQLLLAHCGGLDVQQQARLLQLGASHVTDFTAQQWALREADVVISHGGLNTVLDAICAGTPLLVMPLAFDQPGVAARVRHHRLGQVLSPRAGVASIAAALARLLGDAPPRSAALEAELASCGGVARAADIIETALASGRPVCREASHAA